MDPIATAAAVAGLALVAGVGVVAGFLRDVPAPIEPPADPLDDRRTTLLRSLADLEGARASGALEEAEYVRLRERTQIRMERVLRAIDRRDARMATASPSPAPDDLGSAQETRAALDPVHTGRPEPRRVPTWAVALLIGGTVLAVVVSSLARDARSTSATSPQGSDDPLAFFEQRVQDHPDDLAARLDLALRYLNAGMIDRSLTEYAVALRLDPDDVEALAHVGMILYLSGRPDEALRSVDRSLSIDPNYPEALFFRGVILFQGLDRPREAIAAFRAYLDAAPFGAERETAKDLVRKARDALAEA